MGLRICSSKEEAIQAAEAGLLWLNMAMPSCPLWKKRDSLDVALHYNTYAWQPEDFAVLVEEE